MYSSVRDIRSIKWEDDDILIIDQTKLPLETVFIKLITVEDVWDAIFKLQVRGAPAIGIAAAYGLFISIRNSNAHNFDEFYKELKKNSDYLASSRPTAVNLFWALKRMGKRALESKNKSIEEIKRDLLLEAQSIRDEDEDMCKAIGETYYLAKDEMTILTHCNAGGLATANMVLASAIFLAKDKGWQLKYLRMKPDFAPRCKAPDGINEYDIDGL